MNSANQDFRGSKDFFKTPIHGFIIFPSSHIKEPGEEFDGNIRDYNARPHKLEKHSTSLHFELPRALPQVMTSPYYEQPYPMSSLEAAGRLFSPRQRAFAASADYAARKYLGIGRDDPHSTYTHLHGIGRWENKFEPSMATLFHKPITPSQLLKIAADVGSWARQEGVLLFTPHRGGSEQMMHLRIPTHSPRISHLNPQLVSEIINGIAPEFDKYRQITGHNAAGQPTFEYLMPGASFLPDTHGHTDALVWIPPWSDAKAIHSALGEIANKTNGEVNYWNGTGTMLGGTHPYSWDEAQYFDDKRKRDIAVNNYRRILNNPLQPSPTGSIDIPDLGISTPPPERAEPHKLARSPEGTGIVVRGVYYKPGSIIPDLVTELPPQNQKKSLNKDDFVKKLRIAYSILKGTPNAGASASGSGDNGSSANGIPASVPGRSANSGK